MSRKTIAKLSGIACGIVGFFNTAQGQTFNVSWDGGASGLYSSGISWSTNVVPLNNSGLGDFFNVTINRSGGTTVTGDVGAGSILNLTIGANPGNHLLLVDTAALSIIGASGGGAATVNNQGTISLGSTIASTAQLLLAGTTTNLTGGGTINLVGDSMLAGSGTVTSNNNLIGVGNIGNDAVAFINTGTISASGGSLTLDGRLLGGFDNNGLMQSLSGGTLVLNGNGGGAFDNAGGTIHSAGRVQLLNGAAIIGGNISSAALTTNIFFVPGGQSATLNGVTSTADVNVGINSTLSILGTITNNARIRTNTAPGVVTYNFGSSTATLNGTGSLTLGPSTTAFGNMIGTGTLVNGSTHSILGGGTIGNNSFTVRNTGTISTGFSGHTVTIDPGSGGVINTGSLVATAGATLNLSGNGAGAFNNTSGTISNSGGRINLINGASIVGGTLNSADFAGNSQFNIPAGNSAGLSSLTSNAEVVLEPTGSLTLSNTLTNNGLIRVNNVTGNATINIGAGTSTLAGNGSLLLAAAGVSDGFIIGSGTFVNGGGHSIVVNSGEGTLGDTNTTIRNTGTISSLNGSLYLNGKSTGTGMFNSGTVLGSSSVFVQTPFVENTGTFISNAGSIRLVSSTINGGTVQIGSAGELSVIDGGTTSKLSNGTAIINGAIGTGNGVTLALQSMFVQNNGIIDLGNALAGDQLRIDAGTTTLSGNGIVALGNDGVDSIAGVGILNNIGNTIGGAGSIGGNTLTIVSSGTITATTPTALTIDPGVGGLTNTGTLTATNGAVLVLSDGTIQNGGGTILANGSVRLTNNVFVQGGNLNSGTLNVFVPGGNTATIANVTNHGQVGVSSATVATLNLVGTITNNGRIAGTGFAVINAGGGTTTLAGTGSVQLGGTLGGSGTLVNSATHLIVGEGTLGNNAISIRNAGTISANQDGDTLTVDPGVGIWTNSGTMSATGGGILALSGAGGAAQLGNTGGRIAAEIGSNVRLTNGVIVNGGSLVTNGSGTISVPSGHAATVQDLTNAGNLRVDGGGTLIVDTSLTNTGSINVDGASSAARLLGATTGITVLTGGTVNLIGNSANLNPTGTFENHSYINGRGSINGTVFINGPDGVVEANVPGGILIVQPGTFAQYQNGGVMRAVNGGVLQFDGGFFIGGTTNIGGGTMLADNGSRIRINQAGISGGTIVTAGTGSIEVLLHGSVSNTTVNGRLFMSDASLTVGSLVTLNGPATVNFGGAFELAGLVPSTLRNTSTILMNPGAASNPSMIGSGTFINDGTISGGWRMNPSGSGSINVVNSGLLEGTGTTGFQFTDGTVNVSNTGTLRAAAGSNFQVSPETTITGLGTIDVRPGGSFVTGGVVNAGSSTVDGTLLNVATAAFGQLSGSGTLINGFTLIGTATGSTTVIHSRVPTVLNVAGTIKTTPGGGTLGTSRVTTLSLPAGTKWDLTDHDLVVDYSVASPFASILTAVQSGFAGGAWTGNGLTSSSAQAAAATPDKTGLAIVEAGELFPSFPRDFSGQSIDSTTVLVKYTLLGDTNLDSIVNITDFAALAANFNTGGRWNRGDFNYDSLINIADFALLASNFNKSLTAELPRGGSVPEPTVAAFGLAVIATLRRRHSA